MTTLLTAAAGVLLAQAIYFATLCARASRNPEAHLDGDLSLPGWCYIFGGGGVVLAGVGLHDHLVLVSTYGLQYSHVAIGLILVAIAGSLFHKRIWLASRITRLRTLGELLGSYYRSPTIRIYLLAVLFLFSIPFASYALLEAGNLVERVSSGLFPSGLVVWTLAFFIFLFTAIGGWRAVVYVVSAHSLLVLVLLIFSGGFVASLAGDLAVEAGTVRPEGILQDRIPGVIQFTDGIGKEASVGGIWTTVGILSFSLALLGLAISPGLAFLGITTAAPRSFPFKQVWIVGGLIAGILLLAAPVIGAETAPLQGPLGGNEGLAALAAELGRIDQLVAVAFVVMLLVSLEIAVAFFVASGANIAAIELVARYVLPDISPSGRKLAARVVLAAACSAVALAATFTPLSVVILSSLTLSLSVQMLPAVLGLCWLPWVSRSGVLAGLVIGTIIVVFTEPFGLIAFEALFLDLPWGRWPLTIHSAGWSLVFNFAACLLVSFFTRASEEREQRQRLHDEFARTYAQPTAGRAVRTAKWTLVLLWVFLALGPGAILGNTFFSQPIFAGGEIELGVPSLLVWQIVFWLIGVALVWWLTLHDRVAVMEAPQRMIVLSEPTNPIGRALAPAWIARLVERLRT
jgi:Na+/proline symporter